ncbi:MAG: hypothetical protein HKO10_00625 [Acidimicrobiia bacterium]|nr:hypothetical protein [Acidimicrobiia bacterium]
MIHASYQAGLPADGLAADGLAADGLAADGLPADGVHTVSRPGATTSTVRKIGMFPATIAM